MRHFDKGRHKKKAKACKHWDQTNAKKKKKNHDDGNKSKYINTRMSRKMPKKKKSKQSYY